MMRREPVHSVARRHAFTLPWLVASLALFALFGPSTSRAAETNASPVFHGSLKAASEAAAQDQSLVLLIFGAEWCGPCKQLKAKTLGAKEFLEPGGALHVAEVDVDADAALAGDYKVNAVPTLVLLTADGKIVDRAEGFMEAAELLRWVREGRERAKQGKWEGTAPGSKLAGLLARAGTDQLDTNDVAKLIGLLGEPNPADREAAARLLMDQRELAVVPLIEAVSNSYLGVRIAASETLHKLAPEAATVDPWQAPVELADAVSALKKWWAQTGRLPARRSEASANLTGSAAITSALEHLRGSDPTRRTEAMSALVGGGMAALPPLREAIKRAEKTGDQRGLALLEDVLWAILISDDIEQRAGSVRSVLARGRSPERQAAAARLGRAGREAIPALTELANDPDPLVVESAVRALSSIGGKDVIPATAALLKAADGNLRMTAAQALGHTKNTAAVTELLSVLNDPNEVVACAALSALLEISGGSEYSSTKKTQPLEVIQGLKSCLADPRWRVRAAAAEVSGKLGAKELIGDLNGLLDDSDGFVIKSALEALQKLTDMPAPDKLLVIAKRHSDLQEMAVEMLMQSGTDDAAKSISDLYNSVSTEGRIAIIHGVGAQTERGQEPSPWQSLLSLAAADADPRLRRAAAESLASQPPKVCAALVGPLLSDDDEPTRAAGAGAVLSVISGERQLVRTSHGSRISSFVISEDEEFSMGSARKKANPTNEPPITSARIAEWHLALQQKAGGASNILIAAALYVTGSSNADLPVLERALERLDDAGLNLLAHSAGAAAIIPRLPWPQGKAVAMHLSTNSALLLPITAYLQKASPGLRDFLLDPPRFRAAVDPASGEQLETALTHLLGSQRTGWSLLSSTPPTKEVVHALMSATNAAWRAAAVYAVGLRGDPEAQETLVRALGDTNGWVRAMAAGGLARVAKDLPARERLLSPLLNDPDKKVARSAALGLLEPEVRSAAGLEYASGNFEFEKIHVWSRSYEPGGEQRPLATVSGSPLFLQAVRTNLASGSPQDAAIPALLLAQYGDFTGIDQLLKHAAGGDQKPGELDNELLTAIALSRDPRYLPFLKTMAVSAKDEQDFRRLLQAIKGMSGAEAREMRLDINKRMRQGRE